LSESFFDGTFVVAVWLNKFRRIVTPWECDNQRFTGFVHLALRHDLAAQVFMK
jgi:hypothetical protein